MGTHQDQRRTSCLLASGQEGSFDGLQVVSIRDDVRVPAIGREPLGPVLGEGELGRGGEGDAIVIVEADKFPQLQVARQRSRLGGHALHEVAIAHQDIGEVVDEVEPGPVVAGGEMRLSHGEAHSVAEPLAQGAGGGFHAGREATLRVARGAASPLAELFQLFQGQIVAGQMQQGVEQGRAMPGRQDEPIPVEPVGVARMVLEEPRPEHIGHWRSIQGQTGMPAVRLLDRIHREKAQGVNGSLVQRPFVRHDVGDGIHSEFPLVVELTFFEFHSQAKSAGPMGCPYVPLCSAFGLGSSPSDS